jgi:hypothetical protein
MCEPGLMFHRRGERVIKRIKIITSLSLIKRPHHEGVCGSGGLAHHTLKLEARRTINTLTFVFVGIKNWRKLNDLVPQPVK